MKRLILLFCLFSLTTLSAQIAQKRVVKLMGSRFDITIVAKDAPTADAYIDTAVAEITRIENLISEWMPHTQVSQINQNAGIKPVVVDKELFDLTERAIGFSKLTDGAFDISFAAADKIWKYDGSMTELPSPEAVKESVKKIGYQNIILDREKSTIFLKLPGMKIGFGSIGKGYAADKTKDFMMAKGVVAGIINASGDMNTWGKQPDGKEWTVGITNPMNKDRVFAVFPLTNSAVVTSGNYEKYVMLNNKRYSHIIDPRTGYPATGIASVTVFAKSAEMANGLSTSVVVLGRETGMNLIDQIPQVSAVIVDDAGKVYYSRNAHIKKLKKLRK
ncbi:MULTISPECIES: FAD:protein FMN transferase [Flavobacterium]|uniref:FAD:protein FMN transferase n=1 Tax=Flavobacterium TaxID=237 RepID=UPI00086D4988|nr:MULTISPECIES: FAD:protein FMN transferase [Flavobacterium]MBN9284737.1 FAD:protein FMN transferase [Flavobacterium sp.]ODS83841.1 MAG: thiamine biosynthesis protein ApbE [Chryseobacterium sp. SCN 40-13]OJV71240.1 MAG: thiamine biosynthesis protein ApbE [Flavobacterium sp. 40-81]